MTTNSTSRVVRPYTSRAVDSGGVLLATRDYGGDGPALVLMHGAGMSQSSLAALAGYLPAYRVVSLDFRGHGGSESAPWSLEATLGDVKAVVDSYGLQRPVVGGHSLGGMVAVAYGVAHPECPAVVNVDGHGRGRPSQYVGYDEAQVRKAWVDQDARFDQLTTGLRGTALKALLRLLRQPVIDRDTAHEVTRVGAAMDLPALYEQLSCPLLVFNAIAPETRRSRKLLAGEGLSFAAAYRKGLQRDLAVLAANREATEAVTVDAGHVLVRSHPELVADTITAFLDRVGATTLD